MVFTTAMMMVRSRGPDEFWRKRKIFKIAAVNNILKYLKLVYAHYLKCSYGFMNNSHKSYFSLMKCIILSRIEPPSSVSNNIVFHYNIILCF